MALAHRQRKGDSQAQARTPCHFRGWQALEPAEHALVVSACEHIVKTVLDEIPRRRVLVRVQCVSGGFLVHAVRGQPLHRPLVHCAAIGLGQLLEAGPQELLRERMDSQPLAVHALR